MTKVSCKPWNIYEITSPTRNVKTYWFDQSSRIRNGTFRSKIRSRYLLCEQRGILDTLEPAFFYGDRVSVSVNFIDTLPKTMTLEEVKQVCRNMTSINERLHEETGEIITFNRVQYV